ncbi:zinc ribbon domain-containing protein [Haloarcula marina]|uniref:zinc ribbon domain-containing protein n=1 Tax=Haloarcula marina TaxID=2961574 RepID=UPI0020B65ED3|nr:zinc ribbon domain-containing protein [Halomicroarcula marina]
MSTRLPRSEFRRSLALLRSEWWVAVGGGLGYLAYGAWVAASGIGLRRFAPGFADGTLATVGGEAVTGLAAAAVVLWLVLPALVASRLTGGRFLNQTGNLASRYRLDHPSTLLAPPGLVMLGCLVASLTVSRSAPLTVVALVASVHLLVRTIAYGYRVYALSVPRLFGALRWMSAVALGAAWLVHATALAGLSEQFAEVATASGVSGVVSIGLTVAGVDSGIALSALVSVPAVLASGYLLAQTAAGAAVRRRAPLENPTRRAGQRFPTMRPGAHASGGGGPPTGGRDESTATHDADAVAESTDAPTGAVEDAAVSDGPAPDGTTGDDDSSTRVFSPGHAADAAEADTAVAAVDGLSTDDKGEDEGEDDPFEDTAVFSPDRAGFAGDRTCDECGTELPADRTPTFCPDCGERLDR